MTDDDVCGIGPEGHEWTITFDCGGFTLSSGCETCDLNVIVDEITGQVSGRLKYWADHPDIGGWHYDVPCDCNWGYEFDARPVPEPATKPAECPDCRGFKSAYPHLTDEPCSVCGGSGVATTEGNEQ